MLRLEQKLTGALKKRLENQAFRKLTQSQGLVDFCSNDYLGFAANARLKQLADSFGKKYGFQNGSTGSRLITGNSSFCEELEKQIAQFHRAETGLIFNSGYDANLALLSCLASRHDTVIYDQLVHASIRDGIQLSKARSFSFRHNDVEDLEKKIISATGQCLVVVESVYSMDGDTSPLPELAAVCEKNAAALIVDEAHATGVYGAKGEGLVQHLSLEKSVFARVHTFGKALGVHGAIVLGSATLRQYLINFARPFIYSTALPSHSLYVIKAAYGLLEGATEVAKLRQNISLFKSNLDTQSRKHFINSDSAIQIALVGGNAATVDRARKLREALFDVRPILHPTVALGQERLRICLHSFNTREEILGLSNTMNEILRL